MNLTRQARACLIEDYKRALGKVNQAAHDLEDASVFVDAAGPGFTRSSVALIEQLNTVYLDINEVVQRLREVPTDD